MRHAFSCALKSSLLVLFVACTAQPPIVADPPEHIRPASEPVPWEKQYGRAMMKPEALAGSTPDPHSEQRFNGQMEHTDERGTLGTVADVLAFPFRAIGWLFHAIF
jgi:hypothetical protein